ncbi:hypothetical protein CPB86DRAFT_781175 [Serendipita vermifera]|nr:hypothetical protein CPB86DRAFT_781175 [Serendipita vermifera]
MTKHHLTNYIPEDSNSTAVGTQVLKLLTASPVHPLLEEAREFLPLGHKFYIINDVVSKRLPKDAYTERFRSTLEEFRGYMYLFCNRIAHVFVQLSAFYSHKGAEIHHNRFPQTITDEDVAKLLDPVFQRDAFRATKRAILSLDVAIELIDKEIFPRLPDVERELKAFVDGYLERHRLYQQEVNSWSPRKLFRDLIFGPKPLVSWKVSEVRDLPSDFTAAVAILKLLPPFLERTRLHVFQLSQLGSSHVVRSTYVVKDLHWLYVERIKCRQILNTIGSHWDIVHRAFYTGAKYYREHLSSTWASVGRLEDDFDWLKAQNDNQTNFPR